MGLSVIGLSGKMGSGKDEVYRICTELLRGDRIKRFAFGDEVKAEVASVLNLSVKYVDQRKQLFRPILQWWGTEYRRQLFGPTYWIDKMRDQLTDPSKSGWAIVTDVRFENEAELIQDIGGYMVRVDRPGFCMCEKTADHPSETDLDFYDFDYVIRNNGELDDLKPAVGEMIDAYRRERTFSQPGVGSTYG